MKRLQQQRVSALDLRDEQYKGFLIEQEDNFVQNNNQNQSEEVINELDIRSELYRGFDPDL